MALTSNAHNGAVYSSNIANKKISHWISKIRLSNFRNYKEADFKIQKAPVILIGKNGSGKTNLLEAISLLAPGRGLRRAGKDEFCYKGRKKTFPCEVCFCPCSFCYISYF